MADETAGLPVGAIVLLSYGGRQFLGIGLESISALRDRRIPVHTVGFGREQVPYDVQMDDANVAPRALPNSRLAATFSLPPAGASSALAAPTVTATLWLEEDAGNAPRVVIKSR
jgi:hypothetical protein